MSLFIVLLCVIYCGTTESLFGANDAEINEFPWMVLLEYRNPNSSTPDYHCAGSLISQRYVLTAAHCISDDLKRVHLGKYDLKNHENCDKRGVCADATVTIDIEEKIKHEEYGKERFVNDIALIRLSNEVSFTDYIQPIALPSTLKLNTLQNDANFSIAGWGEGAVNSTVKQKLEISIVDQEECMEDYENYASLPISLTEKHVCAGVARHAGACAGDAGGSLSKVVNHEAQQKFAIEGILLLGYNFCGNRNNNRYPMLFTNVAAFETWIEEKMRT